MEPPKYTKLILIADDDPEDQDMIGHAINAADPAIHVARVFDGREALGFLKKCMPGACPDAMILDYSMPYFNGAEVLAMLQDDAAFSRIPKFVWSSSSFKPFIDECMRNGAAGYFIKPDSPEQLKALVRQVINAM